METTDRSPEHHSIPDVTTWLTYNDAEGNGVSHASAQCPEFAKDAAAGKTLVVEATATGWLCGFCTDHTSTVMADGPLAGPSVDPKTSGPATGSGTGGNHATDKQVALIEKLSRQLGIPTPAIGNKAQASEVIESLLLKGREAEAKALTDAAEAGEIVPLDEVEAWLAGLGRKVEPGDVNMGHRVAATAWAKAWTGTFEFMVDMHAAAEKGLLSAGQAKGVLNCWRADINRKPKTSTATPAATGAVEDGMYQIPGGDVVKVQIAKQGSGNLYAKRLIVDDEGHGHFEYEQGLVRKLRPEWKMSLEDAKAFGKLYGICCNCGADLTDEHSIAEGIGPICAKRF
jgi:predicted transcriptional regulator